MRRTVLVGVAVALAAAFAPIVLPLVFLVAVVFALGTLLARGSWVTAMWFFVTGAAAAIVAALLNLPWISSWSWEGLVGAAPIGSAGLGLLLGGIVRDRGDRLRCVVPRAVHPGVRRAPARPCVAADLGGAGALLVVVFGALAVLADRGSLPFTAPQAGVLLVPVALGTAIAAAAALAAFDLDVRGASFGWKQPLGILASVAIVVGLVPGVMALADGSFQTPSTPLAKLIDASLPDADETGDYNVLLIGDARLLPVPSTEYRDGVSWAIIDDGALDARDRWMPPANEAADLITTALDEVSASSTLRAGRLLAPLGIRYVVIPEFDGVVSTVDDPLPHAGGSRLVHGGSARSGRSNAAACRRWRCSRTGRGSPRPPC